MRPVSHIRPSCGARRVWQTREATVERLGQLDMEQRPVEAIDTCLRVTRQLEVRDMGRLCNG